MGVDFNAILDHHLSGAELAALPERLNAEWQLPAEFAPWEAKHIHGDSTRWEWKRWLMSVPDVLEELRAHQYASLNGPGGFSGWVYEHALVVSHVARWWSFLYDADVRLGLQLSCRRIASTLGSDHIVYVPDSSHKPALAIDLLHESKTVSDVLRWLHAEVGAPAADVTWILSDDDYENADERCSTGWFHHHVIR